LLCYFSVWFYFYCLNISFTHSHYLHFYCGHFHLLYLCAILFCWYAAVCDLTSYFVVIIWWYAYTVVWITLLLVCWILLLHSVSVHLLFSWCI
jgi:hypothetical protein